MVEVNPEIQSQHVRKKRKLASEKIDKKAPAEQIIGDKNQTESSIAERHDILAEAETAPRTVSSLAFRSNAPEHGPNPRKKRLDVEEVDQGMTIDETVPAASAATKSEDGSDDEAPEEVAVSAKQDVVGAKATKTAKLAFEARARRAQQSKQHDARMKAQAEAAKQRRQDRETERATTKSPPNVDEGQDTESAHLPNLLPEAILNEEPAVRLPIRPPVANLEAEQARKLRLLNRLDEPAKDIIRGKTRIRVLPNNDSVLPPTSASKGKQLREQWLLGERGGKPSLWIPRRKRLNGFARTKK